MPHRSVLARLFDRLRGEALAIRHFGAGPFPLKPQPPLDSPMPRSSVPASLGQRAFSARIQTFEPSR